jgi:galactokinase
MEVEAGLSQIKSHFPQVVSFRDCSPEMIQSIEPKMDALLFKRCLFVVQEIERVQLAVNALEKNDFVTLGKLMNATHEGLSQAYEVSCEELDFLVSAAQEDAAVLGARMMGGGFGGCSINLIRKDAIDQFIKNISTKYLQRFNIHLKVYAINISKGTSIFE